MSKPINCICDSCGKEFVITKLDKIAEGELDITYFQCPYCEKVSLVLVEDAIARNYKQMLNHQKRKYNLYREKSDAVNVKLCLDKINRYKKMYGKRCDMLLRLTKVKY